jgi:hypothetical protein
MKMLQKLSRTELNTVFEKFELKNENPKEPSKEDLVPDTESDSDLESDEDETNNPEDGEEEQGENLISAYGLEQSSSIIRTDTNQDNLVGKIKLKDKNIIVAKVSEGLSLKIVLDTGASRSLISVDVVNDNPELAELEKVALNEKIEFWVGNGETMWASYLIYIPLKIEEFEFRIPFLVADPMTTHVAILGSEALSKLNALIDIAGKTVKFEHQKIELVAADQSILEPETSGEIDLKPKQDVYLHGVELPIRLDDIEIALRFEHNRAKLKVKNGTGKPKVFQKGELIGKMKPNFIVIGIYDTSKIKTIKKAKRKDRNKDKSNYTGLVENVEQTDNTEMYHTVIAAGMSVLSTEEDDHEKWSEYFENCFLAHEVKDIDKETLTGESKQQIKLKFQKQWKSHQGQSQKYKWFSKPDDRLCKKILH